MKLDIRALRELKYSELKFYMYLNLLTTAPDQWISKSYDDIHLELDIGAGEITKLKNKLVAKEIIDFVSGIKGHMPSKWKIRA